VTVMDVSVSKVQLAVVFLLS